MQIRLNYRHFSDVLVFLCVAAKSGIRNHQCWEITSSCTLLRSRYVCMLSILRNRLMGAVDTVYKYYGSKCRQAMWKKMNIFGGVLYVLSLILSAIITRRLCRANNQSRWLSGKTPDCGARGPRFESHHGLSCLSRQSLRFTALGTGCAPLLQCLGRLSLPPSMGR